MSRGMSSLKFELKPLLKAMAGGRFLADLYFWGGGGQDVY
jgi:hypothetical protein